MYLYNKQETVENDMMNKIRDLLIEHNKKTGSNIPTEYNLDLSSSQKRAFIKFKMGDSLLILGSAGTGKSRLVKEFLKYNQENDNKTMYITSTTGISAYNIGGITINSFMGIGTAEAPVEVLLKRLRYKQSIRDRIIQTEILVIDEISMMSASTFEKINVIFQTFKRCKRPFGGIQLVLTGDFLQLETVFNKNILGQEQDTRLIVESELFNKMFKKCTIILRENFRQISDDKYIDLLLRIREGNHTEEDIKILNTRLHIEPEGNPVHIVSSNKSAQIINESNLSKIKEPMMKYIAQYKESGTDVEIDELLIKELKLQFKQKGIDTLELKKGTRVMLTKNLDVSMGLVNGSVGIIDSFTENQDEYNQGFPIVIFDNVPGKQLISPVSIELELNNCICIASQIPLMLSYALTTHRCQGLTLDSAILDLSTAFCNGQIYVALSRVKSFNGLYLKSFNPSKIKVK
jgi:ATP-dependent DNA helicase PIF1